jgi:hypothetical protein
VCSCVICPSCGAWVIVRSFKRKLSETVIIQERLSTTCPVPECSKEFTFDHGETQVFEPPVSLFERRQFLPI